MRLANGSSPMLCATTSAAISLSRATTSSGNALSSTACSSTRVRNALLLLAMASLVVLFVSAMLYVRWRARELRSAGAVTSSAVDDAAQANEV